MTQHCIAGDWTEVTKNVKIDWDLEQDPLQIKTNFGTTEGRQLKIAATIGNMLLDLSSPMKFALSQCTGWTTDSRIIVGVPKNASPNIFTIRKDFEKLTVLCNGDQIVELKFAASYLPNSNCNAVWAGDVVDCIEFHDSDDVSQFYRGYLLKSVGELTTMGTVVIGKITLAENYVQTWRRRSSDVLQTYSRRNGLGRNRLDVLQTYYRRTTDVKNTSQLRRHTSYKRNERSPNVMENAL
eukprot:sb/3469129/